MFNVIDGIIADFCIVLSLGIFGFVIAYAIVGFVRDLVYIRRIRLIREGLSMLGIDNEEQNDILYRNGYRIY